jgi:signal peptidase I
MEPSVIPPVQHQEPQHITDHRQKDSGLRSVLSTLAVLIVAPIIALLLTAFVFQSYEVDGPSMETTLSNKDRLIVMKVPRTISRITGNPYVPNRGDVVIFVKHNVYEFGQSSDRQLIKRVIGLPGDHVIVNNGKVTVYNKEHPNGFSPDATLPYGSVIQSTPGNVDITVQAGEVFVCGDNRSNSLDSRSFGSVSSNDIVGKLMVRIFPLDKAKKF